VCVCIQYEHASPSLRQHIDELLQRSSLTPNPKHTHTPKKHTHTRTHTHTNKTTHTTTTQQQQQQQQHTHTHPQKKTQKSHIHYYKTFCVDRIGHHTHTHTHSHTHGITTAHLYEAAQLPYMRIPVYPPPVNAVPLPISFLSAHSNSR